MTSPPAAGSATPAAESRLAYLAYHDPLTGLPNRARLQDRLAAAVGRVRPHGAVALLSIDLDDFKLVNDGLGHAAGDEVLCQVAARLEAVRRDADVLARNGGDEFAVLLEIGNVTRAAEVVEGVGRRITEALEAPFVVADAEFRIGASVGASVHPLDAPDLATLQRHADAAMYQAKEAGGGFSLYRSGGKDDPLARLSLAARMRRGLQEGAFDLHYQPVYRLSDGALVGVEALARWPHAAPDQFIPVAERTGVIHALGAWALETVCRQAAAWDARGLHPKLGVNVSPRQLLKPGFADDFARTVAAHGIAPARFVVELTETAWTVEATRTLPALQALAEAGFVLALDDFGAGYSSLSRLRSLPVDVIKIDRAFMTDLPEDPQAVAVVDAILALANACGCDVVTEGVETPEQLAFLAGRGCRLAQGFGLARPQPADDVTAVLEAELVAERRTPPAS